MIAEKRVRGLLESADIQVNGNRPWDPQVHNRRLYMRLLRGGSLGLGESYMEGWWDCAQLDEFFARLIRHLPNARRGFPVLIDSVKVWLTNRQSVQRAPRVAQQHYDLGNDLYVRMLDESMQYTCAYWNDADNLHNAQLAKLDLICRKLYLEPGMKVLELGGGFGGLARYMAAQRGCRVVSYNISSKQVAYAQQLCSGLPVEIVHADYREANGVYDRVVSIGLCEHVGPRNYRGFFELAERCLKDEGLFLLHTIGNVRALAVADPWVRKYIFPEGHLPAAAQLSRAMDNLMAMEDWHNFGADYDKTLMAWHENFVRNWDELKSSFDDRFYRMWTYYLLACAGGFRSRRLQLWQIAFSKGWTGAYKAVR